MNKSEIWKVFEYYLDLAEAHSAGKSDVEIAALIDAAVEFTKLIWMTRTQDV